MKLNFLPISNTLLILLVVVFGVKYFNDLQKTVDNKVVYIDNVVLFSKFNMTKDIKTIEEKKLKKFRKEIDSLYAIYQNIKNKKGAKAKSLEGQLDAAGKKIHETQENYTKNLTQQVWNRLNNYIEEYAKKNNYEIILGTQGNGTIMYAKSIRDVTNAVLQFCNTSYEGKS